jgi:hypothetical protein
MDFVERIFGLSPDAGSGALEVMLVLAAIGFVAWRIVCRLRQRRVHYPTQNFK